ncbi:hypothetical protein A7981_08435 [Methylovorus sp. MM2]|uniref:hypothetical protein n=1 Tax=Methylovorus sp. MM2 TaxID=1848038 RepID=UPI0007E1D246|nr:hypothetical protein [Methylovorus sp. MM2]OAM51508.1 hypothetical protein A7981_08435 [Methylovorus sp. MM2]
MRLAFTNKEHYNAIIKDNTEIGRYEYKAEKEGVILKLRSQEKLETIDHVFTNEYDVQKFIYEHIHS